MQETFEVSLPENFVAPKDQSQLHLWIKNLFRSDGVPYHKLLSALTEENKDKFGSSHFYDFTFETKRFEPDTLNGRLRIQYKLRLTFSCSGIVNELANQHSYWNFKLDPDAYTVYFIGDEYGDLRSTENEF
jgi:hypothetical protein